MVHPVHDQQQAFGERSQRSQSHRLIHVVVTAGNAGEFVVFFRPNEKVDLLLQRFPRPAGCRGISQGGFKSFASWAVVKLKRPSVGRGNSMARATTCCAGDIGMATTPKN